MAMTFFSPTLSRVLIASGGMSAIGYSVYYNRRAASTNSRIYIPVRYESEFEPLLLLKTPLLANFSIRNEHLSRQVTNHLSKVINERPDDKPLSTVDVEADDPNVTDLLSRYMITSIPTVVAFRGGLPISSYTFDSKQRELDVEDFDKWINSID